MASGLRDLKKARTRLLIADTASRLFAERGYERVAIVDVAREAEVAEQTVYNYFPTKEELIIGRKQHVQDHLDDLIRSRPPGVNPAAAIRDFVLDEAIGRIRSLPPDAWRSDVHNLAAISPTIHRLLLEVLEHLTVALAAAIRDTTAVAPEIAQLQGIALGGVFQFLLSEGGRRTQEGQNQAQIADELRPIAKSMLDELDQWFELSSPPTDR